MNVMHTLQPLRQSLFQSSVLSIIALWLMLSLSTSASAEQNTDIEPRGTGDLGLVISRAEGRVTIVEHSTDTQLATVDGLGDLSHASVVYSRDARYGYVFGRDGGLTKVDLLAARIEARVIQSGNSIGGAISQDGRVIAVSNYEPGGVRLFDADTLELLADIPARYKGGLSKTVGLVDAPGNRFVWSLFDANEIWMAELGDGVSHSKPVITRFTDAGKAPYDALLTPDGRYYIAGLFGEDSLSLLDLWHPEKGLKRILAGYAAHDEALPVYKMPHLEGWAVAGGKAFVPAVGAHKVLIVDMDTWETIGEIAVAGQPVFVMGRPDGRQVWVNFAHPDNNQIEIIDTETLDIIKTLQPGPAVLHMEFTPRGEKVWVSVRDANRVDVYDTDTLELLKQLPIDSPSGIFFTSRAHRLGL